MRTSINSSRGMSLRLCVPRTLQFARSMSSGISHNLTPSEIVEALDRNIIGQNSAKRALAVALRDRWRRMSLEDDKMRAEVVPNNILLVGPTGSGKTECARRLAKTCKSPFIRTEATRFTEVGIVGSSCENMIKDLTEVAIQDAMNDAKQEVAGMAQAAADERLVDMLSDKEASAAERSKMRQDLGLGKLDTRMVRVQLAQPAMQLGGGMGGADAGFGIPPGMEELMSRLTEELGPSPGSAKSGPKGREMAVSQARPLLIDEEAEKLINQDQVQAAAMEAVQQDGIVFVDELDKIAASGAMSTEGGRWSKGEGVQKELLGLLEGTTVRTRHGAVRTDHILFICAGAFHQSKPSDLLPELQGRLPVRVTLKPLTEDDFRRILTETEYNLVTQQEALLAAEGVELDFTEDAITEIAKVAAQANSSLENIGARRLRTVMSKVMEEIKFEADRCRGTKIPINAEYVRAQLGDALAKTDLQRYVL